MAGAIIVGAGLRGLVAAHALRRAGVPVTLLERSPTPGGAVASRREGPYLAEGGPNTLLVNAPEIEALIDELGLRGRVVEALPAAKHRYVARGGRTLPVAPFSPLFSLGGKLRVLGEPFAPRTRFADTSLAEFVTRRLGREVLDYAAAPFVAGIYAGDPARLSVRHGFPKLWELEQRAGSLVGGALRRPKGPPRPKTRTLSFVDGLGELTDALAACLTPAADGSGGLRAGVELVSLTPFSGGWEAAWRGPGGAVERAVAPTLVLTVPAHALAALPLPEGLRRGLPALAAVEYPPVTTLFAAFRRADVAHPLDGFGVLCPPREGLPILGALFSSALFPGRCPEGEAALTVFLGGTLNPRQAVADAAAAWALARPALAQLLGVRGDPTHLRAHHWPRAIPQYNLGHERALTEAEAAERAHPGLLLEGSYRRGISAPQAILAGLEIARRAAE